MVSVNRLIAYFLLMHLKLGMFTLRTFAVCGKNYIVVVLLGSLTVIEVASLIVRFGSLLIQLNLMTHSQWIAVCTAASAYLVKLQVGPYTCTLKSGSSQFVS